MIVITIYCIQNLQLLRKFSTLAASEAAKTNDATAKNVNGFPFTPTNSNYSNTLSSILVDMIFSLFLHSKKHYQL